ncbi:MAG: hypothetical protein ACE5FO_00265 [Parvularculaceae bacterium]
MVFSGIVRKNGVSRLTSAITAVDVDFGGPESYLRYLWINTLGENNQDFICIPTETGAPTLEADRIPDRQ